MSYFGIFGLEFEKTVAIFEINTLKFVWLQISRKNKNVSNASLGYFWAGIWKKYCHIWNQHPRLCLIAKFYKKTKIPKFGTKNALFGYFWTRILKNYCHIGNQLLRICLLAKFCEETKMPNLGLKMPFLSIFDQKCLIWVFLGKN